MGLFRHFRSSKIDFVVGQALTLQLAWLMGSCAARPIVPRSKDIMRDLQEVGWRHGGLTLTCEDERRHSADGGRALLR